MPTRRPRHTVTEVGAVADALRQARAVRPSIKPAELIVRGAEALVEDDRRSGAEDQERRALRERLLKRASTDDGLDRAALREAREQAWSRES